MSELNEKYKLVLDTIKAYPAQLKQAWDEINEMKLPKEFENIENVVVCAMGGSALGARMVASLIVNKAKVPIEIFTEYQLPYYAAEKTLVILSSYSGNTEEVISFFNKARDRGTQIFGISTGGKLAAALTDSNLPRYIFDPINNPSKQPRMSIGYASGAILALLSKIQVTHFLDKNVSSAVKTMKDAFGDYNPMVTESENLAKRLAKKLDNRAAILVASEHLVGTAHTIKNHFNESAKTFSALFDVPELNHHLMEGLKNPTKIRGIFHFVFFSSKLYSERVQKRYPLTTEVVEKNGFDYSVFTPHSDKKINQVFETLVLGSFVVYYLTKDYGIDPLEIPWVDFFKKKLSKS